MGRRTNLGKEWTDKNPVGDTVTFWRYIGNWPQWGYGKIYVWGWQMEADSDWEQVTKAEYERNLEPKDNNSAL